MKVTKTITVSTFPVSHVTLVVHVKTLTTNRFCCITAKTLEELRVEETKLFNNPEWKKWLRIHKVTNSTERV